MSDDHRHMPHSVTGLSVGDAAAHLGISANAVRHKIRRGTLTAYKVNGEWRVTVDDPTRPTPRHTPEDTPRHMPPDSPADSVIVSARHQVEVLRDSLVAPLVALTERQQTIIAQLERERGRLETERNQALQDAENERGISQQRAQELEAERDALQARLRVLEAQHAGSPMQTPDATETATDDAIDVPWWMFWRRL